jgi:hypothetical protein
MIEDKSTNDYSTITDMTSENNQIFKNEGEKNCQVLLLQRVRKILLTQTRLTMSTASLLYISAGNLTGLSESIDVLAAAKIRLCIGIPKFTSTMTTPQPKK